VFGRLQPYCLNRKCAASFCDRRSYFHTLFRRLNCQRFRHGH
jgi:hypothetical protein